MTNAQSGGAPFIPDDFDVPEPPRGRGFWLEPLGEQHNAADYAAWTTSMEHISSTPGFPWGGWPHEMSLADNAGDLRGHALDFAQRRAFTYTVRDTEDSDVIGCVYVHASKDPAYDVTVRSWVRASHADLDVELWSTVRSWLRDSWPFRSDRIDYAPRAAGR